MRNYLSLIGTGRYAYHRKVVIEYLPAERVTWYLLKVVLVGGLSTDKLHNTTSS